MKLKNNDIKKVIDEMILKLYGNRKK